LLPSAAQGDPGVFNGCFWCSCKQPDNN